MLHVVTGGSGSGKSEYAEKLIAESALHRRIYVATMMVWDDEGRKRVRRHREMRSGKGFITIEHYTGLSSLELSTCDKQSTGAVHRRKNGFGRRSAGKGLAAGRRKYLGSFGVYVKSGIE